MDTKIHKLTNKPKPIKVSESIQKIYRPKRHLNRDISIEHHYRNAFDTYFENESFTEEVGEGDSFKIISKIERFQRGYTDTIGRKAVSEFQKVFSSWKTKENQRIKAYDTYIQSKHRKQLSEFFNFLREIESIRYQPLKSGGYKKLTALDKNSIIDLKNKANDFKKKQDMNLLQAFSNIEVYFELGQELKRLESKLKTFGFTIDDAENFERKESSKTMIQIIVNTFFGTYGRLKQATVLSEHTLVRIKEMPHLMYYYNGVRYVMLENWNQDEPHDFLNFMVSKKVLKFLDIDTKHTNNRSFMDSLKMEVNKRVQSISWFDTIKQLSPRINFLDKAYNLETGQIEDHDPQHYARFIFPIDSEQIKDFENLPITPKQIIEELQCIPTFYQYLSSSFKLQYPNEFDRLDWDIRDVLDIALQVLYSTIGLKNEGSYHDFLLSAKGRRGKSTLLLLIQKILGNTLHNIEGSFERRNHRDERERGNNIESMQGVCLESDDDVSKNKTRGDGTKRQTRRNEMQLRSNYSKGRPLYATSHYILDATNNVLPIYGTGTEISDRIKTYFLDEVTKIDPGLGRKLELELPEIALWMGRIVMGFLTSLDPKERPNLVYTNNPIPRENTEELLFSVDGVRSFIEHLDLKIPQRGEVCLTKDELYQAYPNHLKEEGLSELKNSLSRTQFLNQLDSQFLENILGCGKHNRKWAIEINTYDKETGRLIRSNIKQSATAVKLVVGSNGQEYWQKIKFKAYQPNPQL